MTTSNKTRREADDATALARKNKNILQIFTAIVLLCVAYFAVVRVAPSVYEGDCPAKNMYASWRDVRLSSSNKKKYRIELAKTPSQQELGLSDRPCLPADGALLFLYPTDDKFGIWMKNMHFSVDVVWLNKDKKIVSVEKNMTPESYPRVFYPTEDARYVLEFNSGEVDKIGAVVGQTFSW